MKNNGIIYNFLKSNGFKLIKEDTSVFFGDYYDIFTNICFLIKFSSSKSSEMIEIRYNQANENWYDLALVKAILYNEKKLDKITSIEEYKNFLQTNFTNIVKLFNKNSYPATKEKLKILEKERVKQMFPKMR
ncbi:hypothetical protein M2132_000515 [Dysgonomonas sp. PH5-45]|uniref:hypothetical protein n=1 Tax=unclassified Dysgonomonas TaxID=2630389 RepID=UPI0024740447|nr:MULTISPECIES: hypothetical protein [unclassified Dysgonomonas]MDH6354188.1 hypothetical protein [Dysgonomonas sp. PH5-45]MDH6387089.1 hypothetical protein [Dysgonomonas sp. PH5-37]